MQFWSVISIMPVSIRSGKETTQKSAQARYRHQPALYSIVSVIEGGGYILGSIARIWCLRFALQRPLFSRNTSVLNEIEGETTMSPSAQHTSPKRRPQTARRSVGRHQHELKELSWQT
jgi:hypothetical protein